MPGLNELELFREELTRLGDERAVTAQRGDTFEELPLPEEFAATAPDIDVDSLISSLGGGDSVPEGASGTEPEGAADLSDLDNLLSSLDLGESGSGPGSGPETRPDMFSATVERPPVPDLSDLADLADIGELGLAPEAGIPEAEIPEALRGDVESIPEFGEIAEADIGGEAPAEASVDEGLFSDLSEPGEVDISNDFSIPEGLLSGFADEMEAERAGSAPETGADFDVGDFGNFGAMEGPGAVETPSFPEDFASMGDFGAPGDSGSPGDLGDLGSAETPPVPDDFASMGDFGDLGTGETPSVPDDFGSMGDFGAPGDLGDLGDFGSPEAIPSMEAFGAAGTGAGEEEPPESPGFDEMDFTPDFEGIPRGEEPVEEAEFGDFGAMEPPSELGNMDFGSFGPDSGTGDLSADSSAEALSSLDDALAAMGDMGEGLEPPSFGEESPFGAALDLGSAEDIGPAEDLGAAPDFSDLSLPEDFSFPGGESPGGDASAAGADGFEGFSLDEDFLKNTIDNVGDEEFNIPGFADFSSGSADSGLSDISAASAGVGGRKEVPQHIEDEELDKLFAAIAKYPLNLRIAVEEYVAGDSGSSQQKMELIHSILRDAPLRKIAHILSDALGKTIEVPKDFEKKTFAEYEEERASLRYVFFNKILPIFTMGAIAAILLACVAYLSFQFIYRPLAAESLYRRGYAAIGNELYTQSQDLFNQAIVKWERKGWYFKYAEAYREHRQYLLAERMYLALLSRYDNDKKAGLDYADMLVYELRNFEKAESVLRRRVLDNYVNDPDGLMLLGDDYLEWADEDPSKFEEARKCYATLIELYGEKDPYLARMMRYFIRTDNLAEVLPLKDHFLPKKSRISAQDLVELGGYLVDKRYEPKPGDSEALRDQIEDLRKVLERGVSADDKIPEAHYNMGRFLIYNYNPDLAYRALDYARTLFDDARVMTPRRVLTRVDTYRLLGELRSKDGEYLDALDLYAQGIDIYERQRANGSVGQDRRVGLLYADSANIDYFLVDGHGDALAKYRSAVAELNDTPSIRYRIGFLEYLDGDFENAYDAFRIAHADVPDDRSVLYSLGNTLMHRDDVFLAQGYYELLMGSLDAERLRKGISFPSARADFRDFVEEYVRASNNLGVSLYRIAQRNGDSKKYARAAALFAESIRASDSLTRDPVSMVRSDAQALAALNLRNMSHPANAFKPEIYVDIPQLMQGEEPLRQREDQ